MRRYCRAVTEIAPVPWVILSAAEEFSVFQHLVEIACDEGASGFMVGRAIFQEAVELPTAAERERALSTIGLSRLGILRAIAERRATPWTDKVTAAPVEEGWCRTYGEAALVPA